MPVQHDELSRTCSTRSGSPAADTALLAVLTGAAAQVQDSTAKPVGSGTGARLDEVLVTAQRRREPMQKVPISMTVLGEQQLQRLSVQSLQDVARQVQQQIVPGCGDTIAANSSSATSEAVRVSNLLSRIGETDLPSTRRYAVNQSRAPPASR